MNKMMEMGVVSPASIGSDGKPRAVSHILEMTKDVPEPKEDSDSE